MGYRKQGMGHRSRRKPAHVYTHAYATCLSQMSMATCVSSAAVDMSAHGCMPTHTCRYPVSDDELGRAPLAAQNIHRHGVGTRSRAQAENGHPLLPTNRPKTHMSIHMLNAHAHTHMFTHTWLHVPTHTCLYTCLAGVPRGVEA